MGTVMEELRIQKTISPYGFGFRTYTVCEAVKFDNGKIVCADGKDIKTFESEEAVQKSDDFKIVKPE